MSRLSRSPLDLLVVALWTVGAVAAVNGGPPPTGVRTALALPLVIAFPGYVILAVLFPETSIDDAADDGGHLATIDSVERAALSVAVSAAVVPLVAFGLNYTALGIALEPLSVAVGGLVVGLAFLGLSRRLARSPAERYEAPLLAWTAAATTRFVGSSRDSLRTRNPLEPTTDTRRLLNVLFVVSLLTFAGTVGYAAVTPPGDGEAFTELYLLQQTDDGEYTSEDLPQQFSTGESRQLFVGVGNHEGVAMPYTVVVTLDGEEVDRVSGEVPAGETRRFETAIQPSQSGENVRLSVLLYRGDVPANPTPENAYRDVHLWVSVGGS